MIICSVNQIGKMYAANIIFEYISLQIQAKDRIGLVGRNGCGKTTLLKLLAGRETADRGEIHWAKGAKIGYLAQIPEYDPNFTTKDVLMTAFAELIDIGAKMKQLELEMGSEANGEKLEKLLTDYGHIQDQFTLKGGYEIEANIEKIVNGLNICDLVEKKFSTLSGGEKTKVGLALILLKAPDLLLLDEPTNHLDLMAVEWLGKFLQEYEGTVVIVSHDRYFLDEVVTKIFDMEDGELECYHTNFSGYMKEKEERLLKEFQAYEEQQKKIKKMKEAIKRLREWANRANPPSEGLHKRARNMERALERMEKLNRPTLHRKKMVLEMESSKRSGNDVLLFEGVSKHFDDQQLFNNIDIHVTYQQRVAIVGENGTGKSTLIKMILQQTEADEGNVKLGSNVKIGYLPQHIVAEDADETVLDAFRSKVTVTEGEARHILARFLFYGHMVFRKASQLSGGERMRLRLAELMYQDTNLLILDEPTNHLDVESREVLEEALEDYNGTILAVSHDRYFLNKLFNKIYWIDEKAVHCFEGNYNYAKEKITERVLVKKNNRPIQQNDRQVLQSERSVQRQNPKVNYHQNIDKDLEALEQKIEEVEKLLSVSQDLQQLQQLYEQKQALETQWEQICEQLEE